MRRQSYLFDTHSLIFWDNKEAVSKDYVKFFDQQDQKGKIYVSSISFWEISLLVKKGRIEIKDVHAWKNELLSNTNIRLIDPSASELIDSNLLPDHHKDPFDRVLITQANSRNLLFVTKDQTINEYDVSVFWI